VTANKKTLLVDDSATTLFMEKMLLEGGPFDLITAKDGQEAVERALAEDPDLILLDVVTPNTRDTYLGHVEYLGEQWTARAEWGTTDHQGSFDQEGGYLELAYRITENWEVAVRGEDWELGFDNVDFAALTTGELDDQSELIVLGAQFSF
jgi:CheY-like chemotaxis protein